MEGADPGRGPGGRGDRQEPVPAPGIPRRTILVGSALCALSGVGLAVVQDGRLELAYGGPTTSPQARRAADPRCINAVRTSRPWVALTFDDGPDPAYTPAVLDLLRRYAARATFFLVGTNAAAHPDLVARIRREGHLVANHTHDHPDLTAIPAPEAGDQIRRGRAAVTATAGSAGEPWLLRPPVGRTSRAVAGQAHAAGERQVFWTDCLEATLHAGAAAGGRALGESLAPGAVVLAHDGGHVAGRWAQTYDRSATVEALPHLLAALRARGLTSVTVAEIAAAGTVR
ncbi:polysaccharide deacetylase family protein [Arsenicicoccus dermatophilus]|uniref:polysaccharide deacetylase family protein n=1 Tax=Arsenicicoccus dermatophilus TaxID=1076331 RepID=UPI0039172BC8